MKETDRISTKLEYVLGSIYSIKHLNAVPQHSRSRKQVNDVCAEEFLALKIPQKAWLETKPSEFFFQSFEKLKDRCNEGVNLRRVIC